MNIGDDAKMPEKEEERETDKWFISKRQKDFRGE
jgi:hypothetical protein